MPDMEHDINYQKIKQKIGEYAEKVKVRQIERSNYIKNFGYSFEVNAKFPYPYDDYTESHLINRIDSYLLSFNEKEREEVNGCLLEEYKRYFCTPFAKHAKELAAIAIKAHPLSDECKINFLDYLFSSGKHDDFDKKALYKLTEYDPNQNPRLTNLLYNRAVAYLESKTRRDDKYVEPIAGMLNIFADRVRDVPAEAVINYAKVYFALADKASTPLKPWVLGKLATKTPMAKEIIVGGTKKRIDKETMRRIFAAYAEHTAKNSIFNVNLGHSMFELARVAFDNYGYTRAEADAIVATVRSQTIDENGKKMRPNRRIAGLACLVEKLSKLPINPLERDINDPSFIPNRHQVMDYAKYLFEYAAYNVNKKVDADNLMILMQKHAKGRGLDVIPATLFSEARKKKALDKDLVLEVADAYSASVELVDSEYGDFNEHLGVQMTTMFKDIVSHYGYTAQEAKEVSCRLAKGADGDKRFKDMSAEIVQAHTVSRLTGRGSNGGMGL